MDAGPANIGGRQVTARLFVGLGELAGGLVLAVVLVVWGVAWPWRLAVFPPFLLGALGVFQARRRV